MGLEGRCASLILAKIQEKLVQGVGESLVLRVSIELLAQELELVDDAISVRPVTLTEEEVALVVNLVPLICGSILHDEALLLQAPTNVSIQALEPVLQLRVLVRILVNGVDRIEEVVQRGAVREALDEGLEVCQRYLDVLVFQETYKRTFRSVSAACKLSSLWAPFTAPEPCPARLLEWPVYSSARRRRVSTARMSRLRLVELGF